MAAAVISRPFNASFLSVPCNVQFRECNDSLFPNPPHVSEVQPPLHRPSPYEPPVYVHFVRANPAGRALPRVLLRARAWCGMSRDPPTVPPVVSPQVVPAVRESSDVGRRTVIPTFEGNEVRAQIRSTVETEVRQCPGTHSDVPAIVRRPHPFRHSLCGRLPRLATLARPPPRTVAERVPWG